MPPRHWSHVVAAALLVVVAAVGAGLVAHFFVVPALRSRCLLFDDRCRTVYVLRSADGRQMLVSDPATGLTYWDDGTMVHAYGSEVAGICPTDGRVVLKTPTPVNHACAHRTSREACDAKDGACMWIGGACTERPGSTGVPVQDLEGRVRTTQTYVPVYAVRSDTFEPAAGGAAAGGGVVCSLPLDTVRRTIFAGVGAPQTVVVPVPPAESKLDVRQLFFLLRARV